MKTIAIISFTLAAGCGLAQATPQQPAASPASKAAAPAAKASSPARQAKPSTEESALIEQFVSLQDAAIACFLELGEVLESVTDKGSADAAAPKVKGISDRLCRVISTVESLGEPSEAAQQAIMSRLANREDKDKLTEQVMMPLLDLMMQEPPCCGSSQLATELTSLLENLQGAAGMEDEELEEGNAAPLAEPDADEAGVNADETETEAYEDEPEAISVEEEEEE